MADSYFTRSQIAAINAAVEAAEHSLEALRKVRRHVNADVRTWPRHDDVVRAAGSAWEAADNAAGCANAARFALWRNPLAPGLGKEARKRRNSARAAANRAIRLLERAKARERGED